MPEPEVPKIRKSTTQVAKTTKKAVVERTSKEAKAVAKQKLNAKRKKMGEAPAATLPKPETKHLPGKIHGKYLEMVRKMDPKTRESYRKTMAGMEASKIRGSSRILNATKPGVKETGKQKILSLREEQARRIAAYTSQCGPKSYILNYPPNQEYDIGCGEIFLTANLIKIEKPGEPPIIAKRMTTSSGKHKGRLAFCTVSAPHDYVATLSGDKVTILDNQERVNVNNPKAVTAHIKILDQEEATRKKHAAEYTVSTTRETVNVSEYGQLDKNKSILSQIRSKLTPVQLKHVRIIIRLCKAVRTRDFPNGFPPNLIAALIMNAKMESDLRNVQSCCKNKNGTRERSFGLFQKNYDASKLKGETVEEFKKRFMDPTYNTKYIIYKNVLGYTGKKLRAAAKAGASVQQLTSLFCIHIERPAKKYLRGRQRALASTKFFHLSSRPKAIAGKEGTIIEKFAGPPWGKRRPNGRIRIRPGQTKWVVGSSTISGSCQPYLKKGVDRILGHIGIGAYHAGRMLNFLLKKTKKTEGHWKELFKRTPPPKIILAGFALNDIGRSGSSDTAVVEKSLKRHKALKKFFEAWGKAKGVKVKVLIATNQEHTGKGPIAQRRIAMFNQRLRDEGLTHDSVDLAKRMKEKGWKTSTIDHLHLSRTAAKQFTKMLEQA